jgi:hypothetical protein
MEQTLSKYEVTPRDLARGRNLKAAAWLAPVGLTGVPAVVTFILVFFFAASPPAAATFLFLGLLVTAISFVASLILSGFFAVRYSKWKDATRERIAADGIKAEEIEWFQRELKPAEKRALRDISANDLLLADAYRETLASRLTASRIIKSSRREMTETQKRLGRVRSLGSQRHADFQTEIQKDLEKLNEINRDAREMLAEAETRLQMIEAAAMRGGGLADSELALKKLTARTSELPIALEAAREHQEVMSELEAEGTADNIGKIEMPKA